MVELADIFAEYGATYREKYGEQMPPSHLRAMWHIEHCRTETMGGEVYYCDECQLYHYSYHSCGDRHCPKCQHQAGQEWLERQLDFQLPVPYFMVTFTLPAGLRKLARSNQKLVYDLLFRTSAAALQQLAQDPRYVGGQIGLMGVLHTWGRDLNYFHPHVHYLVPGGGVSLADEVWRDSPKDFLVHVKPLSKLFRAKFRDELKKTALFEQVPAKVWQQKWVVHSKAVGNGETALKYLTPYVFRVAISNKRIVKLEEGQVTYRFTPSDTGLTKYVTVPAEKFIRSFLQHLLPKGFIKVRYYGLFSPSYRPLLHRVRLALADRLPPLPQTPQPEPESKAQAPGPKAEPTRPEPTVLCPQCGRPMRLVETLKPKRKHPP